MFFFNNQNQSPFFLKVRENLTTNENSKIMSIIYLENFLANGSFLTLFITTLYYWIQLGFLTEQTQTQTNTAAVAAKTYSSRNWSVSVSIGKIGLILSNLQLFGFFILRWIESQHFPLSNLYESLLFLTWSLTLGHFLLPTKIGSKLWIGAITAPSALFVNAFASLTLSDNLKSAAPLVPALQSNWLMMHVTMMIISYSLLLLGSLFSIAIVFLSFTLPKQTSFQTNSFLNQTKTEGIVSLLDNLSYRTLGFGFPILTIGILSGAVWANQAWGSYWSWDPKETWAFITWVIFAIYFHFRLNKKWSGIKPAIVASIGFVFLWICYLGVNLLGKGLHSYGWFS